MLTQQCDKSRQQVVSIKVFLNALPDLFIPVDTALPKHSEYMRSGYARSAE